MPEHPIPDPAGFPWRREVRSPEETFALGSAAAPLLRGGEILLLWGPLGAGKTLFVQGLARGLGIGDEVVSPTFTLANRYRGEPVLHHLDFYRIGPRDDLHDIGIDAILDDAAAGTAVVVAEWPEPLLPQLDERLELLVLPGSGPDDRIWHLRGRPDVPAAWRDWLTGGEERC